MFLKLTHLYIYTVLYFLQFTSGLMKSFNIQVKWFFRDFASTVRLVSDFFFRFFQIKMICYGGSLFRLRISISWCQFTLDHGGVLTWSPLSSQPHHKIGRIKGFRWVGKSKKKKISFHCSSTCGSNFAEIFSSEVRLCTVIFANISAKTK